MKLILVMVLLTSFICSSLHFDKYLLSIHYDPGILLDMVDTTVKESE